MSQDSGTSPASRDEVRGTRVDHPHHYNHMRNPELYETIIVIDEWNLGKGFCLGNAIKYITRAGVKGSPGKTPEEAEIEDLEKARFYLDWWIKKLKEKANG